MRAKETNIKMQVIQPAQRPYQSYNSFAPYDNNKQRQNRERPIPLEQIVNKVKNHNDKLVLKFQEAKDP